MKKIFIFSGIILAIFLIILFNCQQPSSTKNGSSDDSLASIKVRIITAGGSHTAVLLNNGTVKCWGFNSYGQLGYEDTNNRGDEPGEMGVDLETIDLGIGQLVIQIGSGNIHTVALLNNGKVKCWGRNSYGQLGYGDTIQRGDNLGEMGDNLSTIDLGTDRTATRIAVGDYHTIVLLDDGIVKCWGRNDYGQLGYGDTDNRGDDPGEMGDDLQIVQLGIGRTATQVTAGGVHSVALFDDGTVKCWGRNDYGQLGYGDTNNHGDDPGEMGDDLQTVQLGTGRTATQIAAGYFHTVALLDNGTVKCWGINNYGQLGYGDTGNRGDDPGEMGDDLQTVQLGTGRTAMQIAAGGYHTVVLLDDGTVKCWGRNNHGQLGYGDTDNRGDDPGEMEDNLSIVDLGTGRSVIQIAAYGYHTAILLYDGTVKCWGHNFSGQLGYGDTDNRGDDPGEMGNDLPFVSLW